MMTAIREEISQHRPWAYSPRVLAGVMLVSALVHLLLFLGVERLGVRNQFASVEITAVLTAPPTRKPQPVAREAPKKVAEHKDKPKSVSPRPPVDQPRPPAATVPPVLTTPAPALPLPTLADSPVVSESPKGVGSDHNKSADTQTKGAEIASAPAPGDRLPTKGRLRYRIYYGDYPGADNSDPSQPGGRNNAVVGRAMHEWEVNGDQYRIHTVADTAGIVALFKSYRIEQESRGQVTAMGLVPTSLKTFRNGQASDEFADFDWVNGQVRLGRGGEQLKSLPKGTQDLASFLYQLGYLPDPTAGAQFSVATGKRFENYVFVFKGEETLNLDTGRIRCWHLRTEQGKSILDIWLETTGLHLPLRIRLTDKEGRVADQVIESIELGS